MKHRHSIGLVMLALVAPSNAAEPSPRFQVPKGFIVDQVAAAPLVRYPLFACFDNEGRLYVAEGTGMNVAGKDIVDKKLGRIVVLEDKDGDGKFDTSRVFADGLVFPQGVLWHDGSVYTASHPSFWKLTDTKGTGRADRREEIVTGFNFNGNGCDIHGPFLGPDGRLYWTDGRHGYKIKTRDGKHFEGLAARIWRCRPDGTDLERICGGGFDNPVEIAWTADGEMIGTMDQGPGDCLLHYVEGGVYPMEHPCLKEFAMTGPLLGAVQRYSRELPAALCGTMRYRSTAFGSEFRDTLLTTHYMTHKLVRSRLVRDGSTFHAEDSDFLVSADPNLRPTDVLEDADGSILFVDMGAWFTYGFLGNPIPRPESQGGIYRIRRVDAPPVKDPWGKLLHFEKRSAVKLVALLDDPRPMVRDRAIERLGKLGSDAVIALGAVRGNRSAGGSPAQIRAGEPPALRARRNAAWALCRIGSPAALAEIRRALADDDRSVRLAAIHALGLHRDAKSSTTLTTLLANAEPPLRRKAAEALGRVGHSDAVPALLESLGSPGDRFVEHSAIYALIQINDPKATLPALTSAKPRIRQAGLIALDQMKDGSLTQQHVTPLLNSDDDQLQQAALEIVSRRPAWASLAEGVWRKSLASPKLTLGQERTLSETLLAGADSKALQELVADTLKDPATPVGTQSFLVRTIGQHRGDSLPEGWQNGLHCTLTHTHVAVVREALSVVKTRKLSHFDVLLQEISRNPRNTNELRLGALECLAQRRKTLDDPAFGFLANHLSETTEPLLRMSAARTLAASPLSAEQLRTLAQMDGKMNTMVLRHLLPVFGKSKDAKVGTALVDSLLRTPAAEALTVAELDQTLKEFPASVRTQAEPLRKKLVARQQDQAAYLAELSAALDKLPGDADAGKEVFLSPKANCFACHRAVGRGGEVGADLSKIGQFRTKAELLESIIFPSLTIAPEYRSHQVTMKDGKSTTGLVIRDAADALVLRLTDLSEVRIARTNVEDITPAAVSLMPDGLERTLSRQELRDLMEFLVQQR